MVSAINNSSLMMAGRKKRSVSAEVATSQRPVSTVAWDSVDTKLAANKSTNGDLTSNNDRCGDAPGGKAALVKSSVGEAASGTVAKVAERRKSELTLTIKCSRAKNGAKDVSRDNDEGDDDDDLDSSSSSSSSSNSEDEVPCTAVKRPFTSSVDRNTRTKFPTTAKSTNKKRQQSTDSDNSQGSSDTETARNPTPSSSAVSVAAASGQTPSKTATKRKRSVNSKSPSRKRRRNSTDSKVGCKSALH